MFDVVKLFKIDDVYIGRLVVDIVVKFVLIWVFFMYNNIFNCVYDEIFFFVRLVDYVCVIKLFDEN